MPCTTYPHPTMYISCWQSLLNSRFYYMCVILCFIGRVNQSPCVGLSCNHTQDQRPRPRTQGSRPRPRTHKKSDAKPKDSLTEDRPSRGQGQECSRSRPRTKDTNACVLQKKGLQKTFSGNLQLIGAVRIFNWGGLNHKSYAMTSSKICLLALNQDFAKGEGLN